MFVEEGRSQEADVLVDARVEEVEEGGGMSCGCCWICVGRCFPTEELHSRDGVS